MKNNQRLIQRAVLCAGYFMALSATALAGDFKPLLRGNIDVGGDEMFKGVYDNGDSIEINAGQFFTFSGGVLYKPQTQNYMLEATVGYKSDDATASNGSVEFTRMPLDFIASYKRGEHCYVLPNEVILSANCFDTQVIR